MKRRNSFFEEENVTMRQDKGAPEVDESQQQWDEDSQYKSQREKSMNRNPTRIVIWRVLRPVISVVIGLAIVCGGIAFAIDYVKQNYFDPVDRNDTTTKTVVIDEGDSLTEISEKLEEAGIVRSATVFKYYADFTDMASKLLAGRFELSPSMTMDDIIDELKRPTAAETVTMITFIEGATVEDMAETLVQEGILKNSERFLEMARTGEGLVDEYPFIAAVAEQNETSENKREYLVEGYLFPDTYEVYVNSTEEQIFERLLSQYDSVWATPAEGHTESRDERAEELNMTMDEVIILASIIEKEAKTDDFTKVSAVFHNRLNRGMNLESCATHQYFMKERRLLWTREELQIDSPYNTYLYGGLPLGPICNPSRAAIDAALYPDEEYMEEGYLFFCLGDPATGELFYAKTNEEHEANRAKYEALWEAYDAEN